MDSCLATSTVSTLLLSLSNETDPFLETSGSQKQEKNVGGKNDHEMNPVIIPSVWFLWIIIQIRYLIYGQSLRIPGFDARLIDIHDGHCDLWTHLGDHTTRRASHIPSTNATDSLYLEHLQM